MAWGLPDPVPAAKATAAAANANSSSTSTSAASFSAVATAAKPLMSAASLQEAIASAEAIDVFAAVKPVTRVQLEGVALLQILKHCHESSPAVVTGSLLGLESDEEPTLEVTTSFPAPPRADKKRESDEYQIEMLKSLREVGMDNNKVGWYQSVVMGTFCTAALVDAQFQYQQTLGPNAVCIVYDAAETAKGSLSIKALRLKKSFVDAYKAGVFTKERYEPWPCQEEKRTRCL